MKKITKTIAQFIYFYLPALKREIVDLDSYYHHEQEALYWDEHRETELPY